MRHIQGHIFLQIQKKKSLVKKFVAVRALPITLYLPATKQSKRMYLHVRDVADTFL